MIDFVVGCCSLLVLVVLVLKMCEKVEKVVLPLLNLFRKKPVVKKPCPVCRCELYEDIGSSSRDFFDEDFPTSSTLKTSFTRTGRAGPRTLACDFECKTDGSLATMMKPEWSPVKFLKLGASLKSTSFDSLGGVSVDVADIPKLPGFAARFTRDKTDKCRLKTQYRHPYFSLVSDNAFRYSGNFAMQLSSVVCYKKAGLALGLDRKVCLVKRDSDDGDNNQTFHKSLEGLNARLSYVRGSWNVLLQAIQMERNYSLSIARNLVAPYFKKDMIIGVRFTAHGSRPNMTDADTLEKKLKALNKALGIQTVVAMRTKLTESSFAKMKVYCSGEDSGRIQFAFSEQLSQYARAVFGIKLHSKNAFAIPKNLLCFTLTLSN